MKRRNLETFYAFTLLSIFLICSLHSVQGLKCYTCSSLTLPDECMNFFDESCEIRVAATPSLLMTCDDKTWTGKVPYCTTLSFKSNPKQSNLTMIRRHCFYANKGTQLKGCSSLPANMVFKNMNLGPTLAELQRSKEPFRDCVCNTGWMQRLGQQLKYNTR